MPSVKTSTALASGAVAVVGLAGLVYLYKKQTTWKQRKEEKLKRIMAMFESDDSCYIKDCVVLRDQIRLILDGGKESLQILTDFDKTLSSYYKKDKNGSKIKAHSSFQVVEESSQLGSVASQELRALHDKYYPIEMSPTLSSEEKTPLMIEWYKTSFNVGINAGVKLSLLPSMIKETHVILREGMDGFLRKVEQFNIPLLVASAGLGDVIDEVFQQQAKIPSQLSVLANYYDFDSDGNAVGLKSDVMIHTFNKDQICNIHKPYFDKYIKKTNAFVMGDTLGDPLLSNGIDYLKCILKIGFLNNDVEASLSQYLSAFDLVFTGDPSMDVITCLLNELFCE